MNVSRALNHVSELFKTQLEGLGLDIDEDDDITITLSPKSGGDYSVNLSQLPGCCGVGVIHSMYGNSNRSGLGKLLLEITEEVAKEVYGVVVCTHIHSTASQYLESKGWVTSQVFTNPNTSNTVYMLTKRLS